MLDISDRQLLTLWNELAAAYYGQNGYGGDTAEIYAYTLQPAQPSRDPSAPERLRREAEATAAIRAAITLKHTLQLFREMWSCDFEIDGKPLHAWSPTMGFTHRVHVTVKKTS